MRYVVKGLKGVNVASLSFGVVWGNRCCSSFSRGHRAGGLVGDTAANSYAGGAGVYQPSRMKTRWNYRTSAFHSQCQCWKSRQERYNTINAINHLLFFYRG